MILCECLYLNAHPTVASKLPSIRVNLQIYTHGEVEILGLPKTL